MKDSIENKIIEYLRHNRVSTTEVADALGKTGVLPGLMPITSGLYKVGTVKWIYAYDESNWSVHDQIRDIEEGNIILVDTLNCNDRAIFGELVSKYLLLYKQSKAIVVDGYMRDAAALLREKYAIWCKGFTPVGCFNHEPKDQVDSDWLQEHRKSYEGSIAVCDDCGVVIINKEMLTAEFLDKLIFMENQEDIWFDRLDHYKEDTFDIVCQKTYLKDKQYIKQRGI